MSKVRPACVNMHPRACKHAPCMHACVPPSPARRAALAQAPRSPSHAGRSCALLCAHSATPHALPDCAADTHGKANERALPPSPPPPCTPQATVTVKAASACMTGAARPVITKPNGGAEFFAVGGGLCPQSTPTAPVTVGTLKLRGIVLDNKQMGRSLWIRNAALVRTLAAH